MAILFVSEYTAVGQKYGQTIGSVRQPAIAEQQITVSASSAQSAQFNANTAIVRVRAGGGNTTGVVVKFGTNPTAVAATGGIALSAGQSEYFVVDSASSKLAVVTAAE